MLGRRSRLATYLAVLLFLALTPAPLWGAASEHALPDLLLVIAAMLVAGKLLGEGAERLGLPAVLGELTAGLLLGGSVLGVVPAAAAPAPTWFACWPNSA